jgi:putative ABC transport system permease protein
LSLTLITLTLAGTTFIAIFSVRDSLLTTLDETLAYFGFDLVVIFEDDYRLVEIERAVAKMKGIRAAESWGSATVNLIRPDGTESDEIDLNGPPANTQLLRPEILEGRWLEPDDTNAAVINTDLLGDEPELQVGDQIVLNLESKETTWEIVGIVQGAMANPTVYVNQPHLARLTNDVGKARSVRVATAGPPGSGDGNPFRLAQSFSSRFEDAGLDVVFVFTLAQIRARQENSFNFLINFLLAMAAVLAVVGGLGLSGTMSMNVLERVREIGVVRAVGASDMAVLRLILVEGVIIGLLSWLTGTIVSLPVSLLITNVLGISMMQRPLTYSFSFTGALMWLAIAIILAAVASFLPARGASRLTVREVLAYE